jgi:hypothetical protein
MQEELQHLYSNQVARVDNPLKCTSSKQQPVSELYALLTGIGMDSDNEDSILLVSNSRVDSDPYYFNATCIGFHFW